MAVRASQFHYQFRFSLVRSFGKADIYLRTKFRRDISIQCWDITTSGFWKQTAMLEFFFWLQFSFLCHNRHVILHLPTKFCPNQTTRDDGVISSIQDGGHSVVILLPVSVFVNLLIWEGRNLSAYQISAEYLNSRLRYYYFRFLKTNVRHIGILTPVPTFRFTSPLACHSASA